MNKVDLLTKLFNICSPLVGASPKRQRKALSHSKISQTTIPPRELVQYCKETQTLTEQHERDGESLITSTS